MEIVKSTDIELTNALAALPLTSDPESPDFTDITPDTAAKLGEAIAGVAELQGVFSPDYEDANANPADKWHATAHQTRSDGPVVLNLNTFDCPPEEYRGLTKGRHRTTTVHARQDGTFAYWGDRDRQLNPISNSAAEALIFILSSS